MLYSQLAAKMAAEVQSVQHLLMVARIDRQNIVACLQQATNIAKIARFSRKLQHLDNTIEALEKEFIAANLSLSRENMRACRAGERITPRA